MADRVTINSLTGTSGLQRKARSFEFFDGGGTFVRINDTAEPYLSYLARRFPSEVNRALRHVGWWLRKELQDAVYQGGPDGHPWANLSSPHVRRVFDDLKGFPRSPRTNPFGLLVRAIGYKHEAGNMRVRVGWLSRSAATRGGELQRGFTKTVTPKMRRFYWAAGVPLKKETREIRVPARDLFTTMFFLKRREINERIERRVLELLRKSNQRFRYFKAA